VIADTSAGGAVRAVCNSCGALGPTVPGRSWRAARDAAAGPAGRVPPWSLGWAVGTGLDTTDHCPPCRFTPAPTLLEEITR
jgi:hypothetical protein